MNPTFIYSKTPTGEEAVEQRTRLVQRNLRTVLIMVDGKSSVEELVEKVGSAELVNSALDQLERDGFIKRTGTAPLMTPEQRASKPVTAPTAMPVPLPSIPPAPPSSSASRPLSEVTVFQEEPAPLSPSKAAPVSQINATPAGSPFKPADAPASPFETPATSAGSPFQSAVANPFGGVFGGVPKAEPVTPLKKEEKPDDSDTDVDEVVVSSSELRSRPGKPIFTPKNMAMAGVGLLFVLVLGVLFFPYGMYKSRIEAALSAAVGQPVTVAAVSGTFGPAPTLVLSSISTASGGISIGEVRAVPSVFSLFGKRKSFSKVAISDMKVPFESAGALAAGLGGASTGESFSIGAISFSNVTIGMRDVSLRNYSGVAEMAGDGVLKRLSLHSPDSTLKIGVERMGEATNLLIEGLNWKSGENSPYIFESLKIEGDLSGTRLVAKNVEGRIFGGVIRGQFLLDWSAGMAVAGDISVDYMSATTLAQALGSGKVGLEGQTNARVRFSAKGDSWAALAGKVPLEGDLMIKNGVIHGIDLAEAVRRGVKLGARGGSTRFDQVTSKFRWDGQLLQINEIDLVSGLMRSTGNAGVLKGDRVSGNVNVSLRSSAASISMPVLLTGTLQDLQLAAAR